MGIGMLRRYHRQAPEHVNEPGDVEASKDAQRFDGTPTEQDGDGSPETVEAPAGNASQETWADWVIANVEGIDEDEVRAMKRDELREQYGPRPE